MFQMKHALATCRFQNGLQELYLYCVSFTLILQVFMVFVSRYCLGSVSVGDVYSIESFMNMSYNIEERVCTVTTIT